MSGCGGGGFWSDLLGDVLGAVSVVAGAIGFFSGEDEITIALVATIVSAAAGIAASVLDWNKCLSGNHEACVGAILGDIGAGVGGASLSIEGVGFVSQQAKKALEASAAQLGLLSLSVDGAETYKAKQPC